MQVNFNSQRKSVMAALLFPNSHLFSRSYVCCMSLYISHVHVNARVCALDPRIPHRFGSASMPPLGVSAPPPLSAPIPSLAGSAPLIPLAISFLIKSELPVFLILIPIWGLEPREHTFQKTNKKNKDNV